MLGHHAISAAPLSALAVDDPSVTVTDALALADALAIKMSKVLTEATTLTEALAMKTGKALTDSLSLADAVSTVLTRRISVADALSILDAVSLKTGKALTDGVTLADAVSTLLLNIPATRTVYAPRPLVTLTVGVATKRLSSVDTLVP